MKEPTFWAAPNFTFGEPAPFRSWPYPRNRLERLAFSLNIDDEELRLLIGREVERRQQERDGNTAQ